MTSTLIGVTSTSIEKIFRKSSRDFSESRLMNVTGKVLQDNMARLMGFSKAVAAGEG
ncbi:hypothetical protein [Nitrosospira sp. Nsp13]|uniref:hypothetical protein n=1 Tax=Nitrosospira sp. Nsp13 TaxID=1855332 RepID=UPI001586CD6B|nr:hypothetical protein [Nitrosospira sp. Nsp13]